MKALKTLNLISVATNSPDPKVARRIKLLRKLEEQRALASDPTFSRTVQKRVPNGTGGTTLTTMSKGVRPWWREDALGAVCLTLHYGSHAIELEKGKAGIVVPNKDQLIPVIDTVIGAVKAGELDEHLTQIAKARVAPKPKRAG